MSAQASFFDPDYEPPRPVVVTAPPPGQWDEPSARAAEKMIGKRARQHVAILEWLLQHQPATDEQIMEGAGIGPNSIRARRGELQELGMIRKLDTEGTTRAGNRATRYVVDESAEWEPVA